MRGRNNTHPTKKRQRILACRNLTNLVYYSLDAVKALGVNQRFAGNNENSKPNTILATIARSANAVGVSVDALLK